MESNSAMVVLVGQIPPPYTGQTVMIEILLHGLRKHVPVHFVRMDFSRSVDEVGKFSFAKVGLLIPLIWRTRRFLKRNPDAVLYFPPASPRLVPLLRDIVFLLFVRPSAKHVVYHYHAYGMGEYLKTRPFLKKLARMAYGRADIAVVPTPSCLSDPAGFHPRQVISIPNGRDVPNSDLNSRREIEGKYRILFVGILTEGKGLFDLLKTVVQLVQKEIPLEVQCVGAWASPEEKKELEQIVLQQGLQDVVKFCGHRSGNDLWDRYRWCDVFFFPTRYPFETQGMVVVEAMAFGVPVVASRWRGPIDIVLDGENGILCECGNIDEYAVQLEKLYRDNEARLKMGQSAHRHYKMNYTEDIFVGRWVDLFKQVVSE